jgi:hypothetical protein
MVYHFLALFNLGLLIFSLVSYLAKLNDLIEPLFIFIVIILGLSYGAIRLDKSEEIKIISGAIIATLLIGGFIGWM